MTEWQKEMTERIGHQVRDLRGDRTAVWLSDRTERLGFRVSRSAISELESGKRRSISVAELLVLAAALQVPPARLLFPTYPDGDVEALPGVNVTSLKAVDWFSGARVMVDGPRPTIEPLPEHLTRLVAEREGLLEAWIRGIEEGLGAPQITDVVERREALNRAITEAGGVVSDGEG